MAGVIPWTKVLAHYGDRKMEMRQKWQICQKLQYSRRPEDFDTSIAHGEGITTRAVGSNEIADKYHMPATGGF